MKKIGLSLSLLASLSGCAALIEGTSQSINLTTTPQTSVLCEAKNNRGQWKLGQTPGYLEVKRSHSDLIIHCENDQYKADLVHKPEIESWVLADVALLSIGGIIIDLISGAFFSYDDAINVTLTSKDAFARDAAPALMPAETEDAPVVEKTTETTTTTKTTTTTLNPAPEPAQGGKLLTYDELVKRGMIVESGK